MQVVSGHDGARNAGDAKSMAPLRRSAESRFNMAMAIAISVVVFAGFAKSYYLKTWFGTPSLTALVHFHGALMTGWFVLFFFQTGLIASHRVRLHRALGALGAALAATIVVIGVIAVVSATARELHNPDGEGFFVVIRALDLYILLVFGALVTAAVLQRRHGDWHKRLILLASLSLLAPAISRLPIDFGPIVRWLIFAACVFLPAIIDTVRNRRLHPVFGWGAPFVAVSQILVFFAAQTDAWGAFAKKLLS